MSDEEVGMKLFVYLVFSHRGLGLIGTLGDFPALGSIELCWECVPTSLTLMELSVARALSIFSVVEEK